MSTEPATQQSPAHFGEQIKLGGEVFVKVYLDRRFSPDAKPTIEEIGTALHLPCGDVLDAILSVAHNAMAARLLFAEVVGRTPFPGLAKARMELRARAWAQPSLFDELTKGGLGHETAVFKDWRISARNPILLRLSGAFADVLKLSRGYRGRTLRLRATKVDFGDLEQSLMLIKQDAHLLSALLRERAQYIRENSAGLAYLQAAEVLLTCLERYPKEPPSASQLRDLKELHERLRRLRALSDRYLVLDPPDSVADNLPSSIAEVSASLLEKVQSAELASQIRRLFKAPDVAKSTLVHEVCEVLLAAYNALSLSPQAEKSGCDVEEMVRILASKKFDTAGLSAAQYPDLEKYAKEAPPEDPPSTALGFIGLALSGLASTFGNLTGPSSLSVAMVQLFALGSAKRVFSLEKALRPAAAGRVAGWLYRSLSNITGLNQAERVKLLMAIDGAGQSREGAEAIWKIRWGNRFMGGPGMSAVMGVASLACFFVTLSDPAQEEMTLTKVLNLTSSATGATLGFLQAFQRMSGVMAVLEGGVGASLAVIGGVAMVAASMIAMNEDLKSGDTTGLEIHGMQALGGTASVAGYLIYAGAVGATTGVGIALMAAGVLLSVGAMAWQAHELAVQGGAKGYFGEMLERFERATAVHGSEVEYVPERVEIVRRLMEECKELGDALDRVRERRGIDFWKLDSSRECVTALGSLYEAKLITVHAIATILDISETDVTTSLTAAGFGKAVSADEGTRRRK